MIRYLKIFIANVIKLTSPRYHLSLDSTYYCISKSANIYRFKVYAEHTFVKFTFEEIQQSENILYDINPKHLIRIITDEVNYQRKKQKIIVSEILRDNLYLLSNETVTQKLSGEEICENIFLIEQLKSIDAHRVSYNTGFLHGRRLCKDIASITKPERNVVELKIIPNRR